MADWHGGGGGRIKMGSHEDFQEDEVWSIMGSRDGSSNSKAKQKASPSSSVRRFTSPRGDSLSGGRSAPVEIPDWSKIMKKKTKKDPWDDECHNNAHGDVEDTDDHVEVVHDNEDDDEEMVPPHEYLARRLASTQIASFSMCEGVGRTLKGRDLSKLRNAILTKTGFLE